jgi:TBC1 domain family member 2
MTARSPPARPHIGIYPSSNFGIRAAGDWVEDDIWDSGSDSESPRQSSIARSWNLSLQSSSKSVPKPVPKPAKNLSSSTLAFSYTHVNAPNSSSYPREEGPKNGWTLIKKAHDNNKTDIDSNEPTSSAVNHSEDGPGDTDVESHMVISDLEPEVVSPDHATSPQHMTSKKNTIREDVNEILQGTP